VSPDLGNTPAAREQRMQIVRATGLTRQNAAFKPKKGEPAAARVSPWYAYYLPVGSIVVYLTSWAAKEGLYFVKVSQDGYLGEWRFWSTGEQKISPVSVPSGWWNKPGAWWLVRLGTGAKPGKATVKSWIEAAGTLDFNKNPYAKEPTPKSLPASTVAPAPAPAAPAPAPAATGLQIGSILTKAAAKKLPAGSYVLDSGNDVLLVTPVTVGEGKGTLVNKAGETLGGVASAKPFDLVTSDGPSYYLGTAVTFAMAPDVFDSESGALELPAGTTQNDRELLFDALATATGEETAPITMSVSAPAPTPAHNEGVLVSKDGTQHAPHPYALVNSGGPSYYLGTTVTFAMAPDVFPSGQPRLQIGPPHTSGTPAKRQALFDALKAAVRKLAPAPATPATGLQIGSTVTKADAKKLPVGSYVLDPDGDVLLVTPGTVGTGDAVMVTKDGNSWNDSKYAIAPNDIDPAYYLGTTLTFDMAPDVFLPAHARLKINKTGGAAKLQALFDALNAAAGKPAPTSEDESEDDDWLTDIMAGLPEEGATIGTGVFTKLPVGSLVLDGEGRTWAIDAAGVTGTEEDVDGFVIGYDNTALLTKYGPWTLDSLATGPAPTMSEAPAPPTVAERLNAAAERALVVVSKLNGSWGRAWVQTDGLWYSISMPGTLSKSVGGQTADQLVARLKTRAGEGATSWLLDARAATMDAEELASWRKFAIDLTTAPSGTMLDVQATTPAKVYPERPQTADGRKIAAGALIFSGDFVFLAKRSMAVLQPGTWGLPGGTVEGGEDAKAAALREAEEELGSVPPTTDTGVRLVVDTDTVRYITVVLRAASSAAATWRPAINTASHGAETMGFAWVHRDDLKVRGNTVVWQPRLHTGVSMPSEGLDAPLALWLDQGAEWDKAGLAAKSSGLDASALVAQLPSPPGQGASPSGLSADKFWQLMGAIPQKNPSGFKFSGVRQDSQGQKYIEYRPRLPDGTRPRIRLELDSSAVATEQAATEMQLAVRASQLGLPSGGKKKLTPKQSYIGTGEATNTGEPVWPVDAMPAFELVVKVVLGKSKVTRADLFKAAILAAVGLPLDQVVLEASEAVEAAQVEPTAIPKGKGYLTKKQAEVVANLYDATRALLGTGGTNKLLTGEGALDQAWAKQVLDQANAALTSVKYGSSQGEANASWLRWIALARAAGLWPDRIDPGARVVYTGTYWAYPRQLKRIRASAETLEALKMLKAETSYNGATTMKLDAIPTDKQREDLRAASRLWLQRQANGPQPPVSANTQAKDLIAVTNTANWHVKAAREVPSWASEPWANVRGFPIFFRYKVEGGEPISSWSSMNEFMGFNQDNFCIRSNTNESWGFIMVPTNTLQGTTSYIGEYEVTYVDLGTPINAEIITSNYDRFTTTTTATLTRPQRNVYQAARPPYGPAWAQYDRYVADAPKANPRRGAVSSEATVIQTILFDRNDYDEASAAEWLAVHEYHGDALDVTRRYLRYRQYNPEDFYLDSFRTITLTDGIKAVVGIPRRDRNMAAK
jgi:8-oxo-dGTP pyrophosphatase MutT (NUDIX family)